MDVELILQEAFSNNSKLEIHFPMKLRSLPGNRTPSTSWQAGASFDEFIGGDGNWWTGTIDIDVTITAIGGARAQSPGHGLASG